MPEELPRRPNKWALSHGELLRTCPTGNWVDRVREAPHRSGQLRVQGNEGRKYQGAADDPQESEQPLASTLERPYGTEPQRHERTQDGEQRQHEEPEAVRHRVSRRVKVPEDQSQRDESDE
jgi:hypothetical protein